MRVDLKVRNTDMAGALRGYIEHRLELELDASVKKLAGSE